MHQTTHKQDGRPSSQGWYFETSLEHQTVVGWVYRYYTGNVTRNFFFRLTIFDETRFTSVQRMENSLNRLEVGLHLIVDFIINKL
jgi:hypothetical protein